MLSWFSVYQGNYKLLVLQTPMVKWEVFNLKFFICLKNFLKYNLTGYRLKVPLKVVSCLVLFSVERKVSDGLIVPAQFWRRMSLCLLQKGCKIALVFLLLLPCSSYKLWCLNLICTLCSVLAHCTQLRITSLPNFSPESCQLQPQIHSNPVRWAEENNSISESNLMLCLCLFVLTLFLFSTMNPTVPRRVWGIYTACYGELDQISPS